MHKLRQTLLHYHVQHRWFSSLGEMSIDLDGLQRALIREYRYASPCMHVCGRAGLTGRGTAV